MTGQPPSGTVTFLMTDLEGSTRLWEQDPEAMKAAMVRHDEMLEKTIAEHNGFVFARMGDGMAAAFETAGDAVRAAATFRCLLAEEKWRTPKPLRARIGLHTDEAVLVEDNYVSEPVNRCSRLMAAAHGGQIVVSGATGPLVRDELPDACELVDLGEHRLRDLGRPMRIFEVAADAGDEGFPPLRTLDAFPGNLPAQVSSFIGRQTEVSRVAGALADARVVTVTGVGGVGKTRLALQVAADVLPRYRDGAWLVDLAPVRDPDGIATAVATVFRLSSRSGQPLDELLLEMLENKRLLLVLDNCEHLIAAVARLVSRIERTCPGVVVLATSREGLAVDGEQLVALPPMNAGLPDDTLENLLTTDAVKLFTERARAVKADFALSQHNSRAVVEICQRLDGVPLAIELAAARVIALSPAELAQRLDRRFQVLAGGRRGAVERHATLRAAIDWSFELLKSNEQRLLGRMAIFSAGCTLEAIEEVCSDDPLRSDDVLDLVTTLVARSLVVAEDGSLATRFRMLETIRQYGEEKLADWEETDALLIKHAYFYGDLSARAAERYYGPEQITWAKRINLERENIRTALATAIDKGHTQLAVQLVADHPHHHGYSGTGEVFEIRIPSTRVIELPGADQQPGYPRVLMAAAWHAYLRGDFDRADEWRRQAIEADAPHPDTSHRPRVAMDSCNLIAMAALASGDYSGAVSAYQSAAEMAAADGYPALAAVALAVSVNAALLGGREGTEEVARAEEALRLARRSGMHAAIVVSLNSLALALTDSDPSRAEALLQESVERCADPAEASPSGVLTASLVAGRLGDWDLALRLGARSMQLERWVMAPLQVAPCLAMYARALAERDPEAAGVLLGAAYATFHRAAAESRTVGGRTPGRTGPNPNFVVTAMHETGRIVAAAVGDRRLRELHAEGKQMTMDDAITYALTYVEADSLSIDR
ncbi:ATP-binding protein [Mycolicibacterium celeriflavum]|uniref:ATP-binding protein n=1 Tax=Mycolicibacterium celeriflavum TaxID=1249101 RepID=UPI003CEB946C